MEPTAIGYSRFKIGLTCPAVADADDDDAHNADADAVTAAIADDAHATPDAVGCCDICIFTLLPAKQPTRLTGPAQARRSDKFSVGIHNLINGVAVN